MEYKFIVAVGAESEEEAQEVMRTIIHNDVDLGFPYYLDWS
jgi:hypothetical protein